MNYFSHLSEGSYEGLHFFNDSKSGLRALVALHNLGPEPRTVPLTLEDCGSEHRLVDLLQSGSTSLSDDGSVELQLEGYGYRWLRVVAQDSRRLV